MRSYKILEYLQGTEKVEEKISKVADNDIVSFKVIEDSYYIISPLSIYSYDIIDSELPAVILDKDTLQLAEFSPIMVFINF